jgi:hypothetical protein
MITSISNHTSGQISDEELQGPTRAIRYQRFRA